jgi:hypothetical protein
MYADPARRDLLISCGAALHHLQVAAAGLGWSARVRRLPDASEERHSASIELRPVRVSQEATDLLKALEARRTDRRRLTSWPVPSDRLNGLASIGTAWGAQVLPVEGDATKAHLARLTDRARRIQERSPQYLAELTSWTHSAGRQGVPTSHLPEYASAGAGDASYDRFPSGDLPDPVLEPEPSQDAMLLVCTSSDDAISRVRAGETLSATWLHATQGGLSIVPLTQAIEVEETRRELRVDVLGDLAFPQMVLRVGWLPMSRRELPPTPRRPLDEVVVVG